MDFYTCSVQSGSSPPIINDSTHVVSSSAVYVDSSVYHSPGLLRHIAAGGGGVGLVWGGGHCVSDSNGG